MTTKQLLQCKKCTSRLVALNEEMCWSCILEYCCKAWKQKKINGSYNKEKCPIHFTSFKHL